MQQDMGRLLLQQETLLVVYPLHFLKSKLSLVFAGTMALFSFSAKEPTLKFYKILPLS